MVVRERVEVQPVTSADGESVPSITLVRLDIGGLRYAVDLASVAAVMQTGAMVPYTKPDGVWIGAVPSRRGDIRVASAAALFGLGAADTVPASRIVVLRGREPVGLLVDQVLSSRDAGPAELFPFPDVFDIERSLLVRAITWGADGGVEFVIDPGSLPAVLLQEDVTHAAEDRRARLARRYAGVDARQALEVKLVGSPERWAIPVGLIRHVANSPGPYPLPRAPRGVTGLLAWRACPVPVIDPTFHLGLRLQGEAARRVVVIGPPGPGGSPEAADCALAIHDVAGLRSGQPSPDGILDDGSVTPLRLIDIAELLGAI